LTAFDPRAAQRVHVGAETWVGEAAVLMADVGSRCIVAAGSVVSAPVPDNRIVGGNPARLIGKTMESVPADGTTANPSGERLQETFQGYST
jgi:acetyltransferase-like isoleucine patch superfamily enzyme